jgi:hypothetical protein
MVLIADLPLKLTKMLTSLNIFVKTNSITEGQNTEFCADF